MKSDSRDLPGLRALALAGLLERREEQRSKNAISRDMLARPGATSRRSSMHQAGREPIMTGYADRSDCQTARDRPRLSCTAERDHEQGRRF